MIRLLAIAAAAAFGFGTASSFAQTPVKKQEELTKEQRTEMRNRADKLKAERAAQPAARGHAVAGLSTTTQPTELTREERAEMRNRAERLRAARESGAVIK